MFPRYLQYLLTDFCQTFVTGASRDRDELIRFWGQRSRSQHDRIHPRFSCFRDISSICWRIFAKLLSLVHLGTQMTRLRFWVKRSKFKVTPLRRRRTALDATVECNFSSWQHAHTHGFYGYFPSKCNLAPLTPAFLGTVQFFFSVLDSIPQNVLSVTPIWFRLPPSSYYRQHHLILDISKPPWFTVLDHRAD